jgi:hypothetical protein
MIDDVIAEHHIETPIRKRQRLTDGRYGLSAALPAWKQASITDRQRIDADSMLRSKTKDQPVCATADFNHTRIRPDWLKRPEQIAHAARRARHHGNDLLFAPVNVFRLALLVGELPLERSLSKLPARLISPSHLLLFLVLPALCFPLLCFLLLCFLCLFVAKNSCAFCG